jgi:hypothetical protein
MRKRTKNKYCLGNLHLLIGSTVWLRIRVGAGGAEGAGYVLFPGVRHILQQQKSRSRPMTAPPIMAPGVVKVQWLIGFFLPSLVIVCSSFMRISASNRRSFPQPRRYRTCSGPGCSWHLQGTRLRGRSWSSLSGRHSSLCKNRSPPSFCTFGGLKRR